MTKIFEYTEAKQSKVKKKLISKICFPHLLIVPQNRKKSILRPKPPMEYS